MNADPFVLVLGFLVGVCGAALVKQFLEGPGRW